MKVHAIIVCICLCLTTIVQAQVQFVPLEKDPVPTQSQAPILSIDSLEKLYNQTPLNFEYFDQLIQRLVKEKQYKKALQITEQRAQIAPSDLPMIQLMKGWIYTNDNKNKQAEAAFQEVIRIGAGNNHQVPRLASKFELLGLQNWAIRLYEAASEIMNSPRYYGQQLAVLYAQQEEWTKAIDITITSGVNTFKSFDDVKAQLLVYIHEDKNLISHTSKQLLKAINDAPNDPYYAELLIWLYTHRNDWNGALIQVRALDMKQDLPGLKLLQFAEVCKYEKQYNTAIKALDIILGDIKYELLHPNALALKLTTQFVSLTQQYPLPLADLNELANKYATFISDQPHFRLSNQALEFVDLLGNYLGQAPQAIQFLSTIQATDKPANIAGRLKLFHGDFLVYQNDVWEASLVYSQIEKALREDLLGEEARFKNAKLAYYRGDFKWAKVQLDVLKNATSELIANDALYLSVLLTENITEDSTSVALQSFAQAELLSFQKQYDKALQVLDSLAKALPEHALNDDIWMAKAQLFIQQQDFKQAANAFQAIIDQYSDDVLGDDAYYKLAVLKETHFNDWDSAKQLYEQLILKYPSSTYVQVARQKLSNQTNAL